MGRTSVFKTEGAGSTPVAPTFGDVAERFKAADSKSVEGQPVEGAALRGFEAHHPRCQLRYRSYYTQPYVSQVKSRYHPSFRGTFADVGIL